MRIGVNGAILARGTSGSARATQDLIEALAGDPSQDVEVQERRGERSSSRVRNAIGDALWDLWKAPRSGTFDLWVSPCNIGLSQRRTPHLLVVYDTMVFDHPELFDPGFARYAQVLIPFSARRADLVLTLSEHSRRRLLALTGGAAPVEVLRWRGPGLLREPQHPVSRRVVMLGATEPHKQQALGIEATAALRASAGEDVTLDVVGPVGRAEPQVRAALGRWDPDGLWTRRHVDVDEATKGELLDAAWLLLQPSRDEGFGLPLLEATERGVPVVHTGAGAMAEVLPSATAPTPDAAGLLAGMSRLLEPRAWSAAVAAARQETSDMTPATFRDRVREVAQRVARPA